MLLAESYNRQDGDLKDGFDCPVCRNKGRVAVVLDGSLRHRECECMGRRRAYRLIVKSGLADVVERYTFDAFNPKEDWQKEAMRQAMRYAQHPEGWLMISGRPGTGKTHLCTAVCSALMEQGRQVRYVLWRDEIGKIKFAGDSRTELIRQLQQVPVLYIDDYLKGGATEADARLSFELLNARYNDTHKLTIISSERTIGDVIQMDEATGSRLWERCKAGGAYIQFGDGARNYRLYGGVT